MKQDFLTLISILIGQKTGHLIADHQEQLADLSRRFNQTLNVTKLEEIFHTEMTFDGKSYLIPPVPFASTNKQNQPLAFAFLGLNPKLFLHDTTTIREKENAGDTWEKYAASYTTNHREDPDIGKFYRSLTILMESLKEKRLVEWTEIVHGCKNAHEKLERYLDIVEKDPILVGEFIPLHSSEIGTYDSETVQLLCQEVKEYKPYLTELFTIISNNLDSNGWLIANGKGASAALEIFIENNWLNGSFTKILDKRDEAYTCYLWEYEGVSRKVLLLHQFLMSIGGKLNSYEDIGKMVIEVVNALEPASTEEKRTGGKVEIKGVVETEGRKVMEIEIDQQLESEYGSFGEYAGIAKRIDQFIINDMSPSAYRMNNVADGVAYCETENQGSYSFIKLCEGKHPFLILRFGKKSDRKHIGIVKQIEFDRKLGQQSKRNLNHLYGYQNEAFIYLKSLAENDNEQTWDYIKKNIMYAYEVYYKGINESEIKKIFG